jgi:DNA mismatch endonuclease, patch repair protein
MELASWIEYQKRFEARRCRQSGSEGIAQLSGSSGLHLVRAGISGWAMHDSSVPGCPDFWFENERLAVFVDVCFWHGCENCCRLPAQNAEYWHPKIAGNVARDRSQSARLRRMGIKVLRIWEHSVADPSQIAHLTRIIQGRLSR